MVNVCADVGKTTTRIGVHDDDWLTVCRTPTSEMAVGSRREFVTNLKQCIDEAVHSVDLIPAAIDQVAIAAPGPVDTVTETGYFLHEEPIEIEAFSDWAPTYLINDATCGAIAEHQLGDHETENLLYITISTGIGAGLIIDDAIVEGWRGNAGEVGHLRLSDCKLPCTWCDGIGHWMAACAGSALPTLAREVAGLEVSEANELFNTAAAGDSDARAVLERMHAYNAEALTQLTNVLNPEIIVLDGGVVLNNEREMLDGLDRHLGQGCFNARPQITTADLGGEAILEGLRLICRESVEWTTIQT